MVESTANNRKSDKVAAVAIIPAPQKLQVMAGYFAIPTQLSVNIDNPSLDWLAQYLVTEIFKSTQPSIDTENSPGTKENPAIKLLLDDSIGKKEAYRLTVSAWQITIIGSDYPGIFYAIQSLRQLIDWQSRSIPQLVIFDEPVYAYRGMHLDVSRHFFPVEFVKRYIDLIARHKMNAFHWHLTDDQGWRIEIKQFPRLTETGSTRAQTVVGHTSDSAVEFDRQVHAGFYTQEQIREIVEYATRRSVTIIPEIDVPGHAAAILAAYPEYACIDRPYEVQSRFGIFTDVLCTRESTFDFLEGVLSEVAALFPGEYIHIGGDEVKKQQWQQCSECRALMQENAYQDFNQLHSHFVKRVEDIAAKLGKRIIGWDEVLDGDIDNTTTIMSWRGTEGGIKAAQNGHSVIMTPVEALYFDFYQSTSLDEPLAIHGLTPLKKVYDFDPRPAALDADEEQFILGAQGNVWTEYMSNGAAVETMVLPRMSALAEVLWSKKDNRKWQDFLNRLDVFSSQLIVDGYRVSEADLKPIAQLAIVAGGIELSLSTPRPYFEIRYTVDGRTPDLTSLLYSAPLLFTKRTQLTASAFHPVTGKRYGLEKITLAPHKALAKSITVNGQTDKAATTLVNGMLATDRIFQYHEWFAIEQETSLLLIDLGVSATLSSVDIGYQAGQYRRLYLPTSIEVSVSQDENDWYCVAKAGQQDIVLASPRSVLEFDAVTARYLKIEIVNHNIDYSEEQREEIAMPVYIDEILVN